MISDQSQPHVLYLQYSRQLCPMNQMSNSKTAYKIQVAVKKVNINLHRPSSQPRRRRHRHFILNFRRVFFNISFSVLRYFSVRLKIWMVIWQSLNGVTCLASKPLNGLNWALLKWSIPKLGWVGVQKMMELKRIWASHYKHTSNRAEK
jgi:hypothetical protein